MKITINRLRVLEIVNNAEKLKSLSGVKLTYAITKNLKKLTSEVEVIKESNTPSEELKAYNEAYNDLVNSEAKLDELGGFIQVGNGQIKLKDGNAFHTKKAELDEKYKDAIDQAKAKELEFEKFLKEPFEFDFYQVPIDCAPESITAEQMDLIFEMIAE